MFRISLFLKDIIIKQVIDNFSLKALTGKTFEKWLLQICDVAYVHKCKRYKRRHCRIQYVYVSKHNMLHFLSMQFQTWLWSSYPLHMLFDKGHKCFDDEKQFQIVFCFMIFLTPHTRRQKKLVHKKSRFNCLKSEFLIYYLAVDL